jgi:hypothetical protein
MPEDTILHSYRRENLKSYIIWQLMGSNAVYSDSHYGNGRTVQNYSKYV